MTSVIDILMTSFKISGPYQMKLSSLESAVIDCDGEVLEDVDARSSDCEGLVGGTVAEH